ncbi:DUF6335 family protein [Lyngbya sp. PCC 8106]|uniref:DUF6335 family protein n=1 Tax=Lyngbya sp. (strain PCC 8106) TaxID=313612 RepID=UPI0000EADA0B|nr:DUF6335 family protein [Lyngbya sp. PCC 8106]EAW33540.1 hypothetical protein L8106_30680 [Lyngbya sp. PCC 8106]
MATQSSDQNLPQYQTKVIPDTPVAEAMDAVPERHDTESLADAVGIDTPDTKPLEVKSKLDQRDEQRWQLDPDSAEDH